MGKKKELIASGTVSDFDSFLNENRKMINEQVNKVMPACIFAGPVIALAVFAGMFKSVSYLTAVFISVFMLTLTLVHKALLKKYATSSLIGMISLIAIDALLIVMDSAHLTIYITWFLIPLLALQFCDIKLYTLAVVINYGFMVFATWHMAPYFAERRTDIATPFAYFVSRLGGLTVETIVMIAAGRSLCKIMSNHYRTLIEQYKNLKEEKEKSMQLQDVSDRAIAASEAKSAFLSHMSHEIRTPINAVLGMNEMILRECEDANVLAYSESIKIAGSTLLGLINDILDFSKIEAGKIEIVPVDYDLSSVINDLVNMIQTRADDKGLALTLDFDKSMPKLLHGDEVRIKQIITNILTNAVKYTEKGSITFSIGYDKLPEDPDYVQLHVSVKDTGIGIKEEDMKRLFSEFERIEEERNRNIEGTGLGMSITKRLLEMMGSSLAVESVYGLGSKFSFTLKQRVVGWEELGDYEASYLAMLKGRQQYREQFTAPTAEVLVVDDNNMNLMVFKSLLKRTKVKIEMAESGDQGIALAYDKKYDVIFLDHMMPGKDGIETLHEMRLQEKSPNLTTPTICLTANAISGARERYLSEGFDDYLTKPIDAELLEQMLMKYLPKEKLTEPEPIEETSEIPIWEGKLPENLLPLAETGIIDVRKGLKNSGTMETYMPLLKIFLTSMEEKTAELEAFFVTEDFKNYTIKVHALKSSARIIGATEFGERAQKLENAGKRGDFDYIRSHHRIFMQEYAEFEEPLSNLFAEEQDEDKPEVDAELLKDAYTELARAAEDMDCDMLLSIVAEIEEYRIPEGETDLWNEIKTAIDNYDYDTIVQRLN